MRKIFRHALTVLMSSLVIVSMLAGCGKAVVVTGGFAEGEIFKINKISCKRDEMNIYLANMANNYEAIYGPEIWQTSAGDKTIEEAFKDTVLAKVSRIKVLNLMAQDEKISLNSTEKKAVKKASKAYMKTLTKDEQAIIGASEDVVYNMYYEYALAEKVYKSIVDEVNLEISDDDARSVTVEHIFIKTYHEGADGKLTDYSDSAKREAKSRAMDLRAEAVSGSDFESLCVVYNEDSTNTHTYRRGEMPENYENIAFDLEEGEISPVVTTEDGFYIIKCINTYERKETEANREAIIKEAKNKAFEEKYNEYMVGLIGNLNEKEWDKLSIIHDDSVTTNRFFDIYTDIMVKGK